MDTKNVIATLSKNLLDEVKKVMSKEKSESKAGEKAEHCSEALKGNQHKIDANKNGKVDAHDFKLLRKKKSVAEIYMDLKKQEVENLDELSSGTVSRYLDKAQSSRANDKQMSQLPSRKRDNRMQGANTAREKLRAGKGLDSMARVATNEESEQIEEKYIIHTKDSSGKPWKKIAINAFDQENAEYQAKNMVGKKPFRGITVHKVVKEEVEELDELKDSTVGSYVKKATSQIHTAVNKQLSGKTTKAEKEHGAEIEKKRRAGLATARKAYGWHNVYGEEVEQIDELSKKTLGSYVNKAGERIGVEGLSAGMKVKDNENTNKNFKSMGKHQRGIAIAINKLTKEEVEELDELSKKTLGSYVKKAFKSHSDLENHEKNLDAAKSALYQARNPTGRVGNIDKNGFRTKSFDHEDALNDEGKRTRKLKYKREDGIHTAMKKLTKEELDQVELTQEEIDRLDAMMADLEEARGRPPKEGSEAWKKRQEMGAAEQEEPRQHPIQQLERIKRDMRGGGDFKHKDGSTHHLTGVQASKLLDKYHGLKPVEKETMQKEIHGSHAGLKKHL